MEKKCENCVFYKIKPDCLKHLPNDYICGNFKSKWYGYWPSNGVCEMHMSPTGKEVEQIVSEQEKQIFKGFTNFFGALCGCDDTEKMFENFLKQDSAIIKQYDESEG